jgi:hypothetical protein
MHNECRPTRRLFLLLLMMTASVIWGQTPPLTTISEVRWSDAGWGQGNNRNLVGRFTNQTFTLARLSQVQDYYLRQYNASSPPLYSRVTTALHVDYPL